MVSFGSGSGSSSTGLKRSEYECAVFERCLELGGRRLSPGDPILMTSQQFVQNMSFLWRHSLGRPFPLQLQENLPALVVIGELGLKEGRQVLHVVSLSFLDILHPAEDIVIGLFVFDLL